jgi:hypothetical protein
MSLNPTVPDCNRLILHQFSTSPTEQNVATSLGNRDCLGKHVQNAQKGDVNFMNLRLLILQYITTDLHQVTDLHQTTHLSTREVPISIN